MWILIIWVAGYYGQVIHHIEFDTKAACIQAGEMVSKLQTGGTSRDTKVLCVPKGK